MLIDRHIAAGQHLVHLTIDQSDAGWDVREELDSTTVRVEHYEDWHRVERAMDRLEREVRHGVFAVAAHH
jgi:hypothetical protein